MNGRHEWTELICGESIESAVEREHEAHLGFRLLYRAEGGEQWLPWVEGVGTIQRDALCREILRLDGELEQIEAVLPPLPEADAGKPLHERVAAAILYAEAGNEYGVPALAAENARLREMLDNLGEHTKDRDHLAAEVELLKAEAAGRFSENEAAQRTLVTATWEEAARVEGARIRRELRREIGRLYSYLNNIPESEIWAVIDRVVPGEG